MTEYEVVVEPAGRNFSAYVPSLPGCIATGATVEETRENMREAIRFHLDDFEDGEPVALDGSASADAVIVRVSC